MGFVLGKRFSGGKFSCRDFHKENHGIKVFLLLFCFVWASVENYGDCSSFEPLLSASVNQPRRSRS